MSAKVVTADAVWQNGRLTFIDAFEFKTKLRNLKLGDGEVVTVRVERPEDAYTYAQLKGYWGFVVAPLVQFTGHTRAELHSMFKTALLVEGQTSITQLTRDEMDEFKSAALAMAVEECPMAFDSQTRGQRHAG